MFEDNTLRRICLIDGIIQFTDNRSCHEESRFFRRGVISTICSTLRLQNVVAHEYRCEYESNTDHAIARIPFIRHHTDASRWNLCIPSECDPSNIIANRDDLDVYWQHTSGTFQARMLRFDEIGARYIQFIQVVPDAQANTSAIKMREMMHPLNDALLNSGRDVYGQTRINGEIEYEY